MLRTSLFVVFWLFCCAFLWSQDLAGYQKLRGEVLSTAPANDYTLHKYNAFDTNKSTGFMAAELNGWIGLDAGARYTLSAIRVLPMADRRSQLVGTVIEGSNSPDFSNSFVYHTITEVPPPGEYFLVEATTRQHFQYFRCINPNHRVSVAEVEFYVELNAQVLAFPQLTNLPTVYLETKGSFDFVTKKNYTDAFIAVSYNGIVSMDPAEVRGRGNSTWDFMEKKPFRIKLNRKQRFLGMPANDKSWTLIANAVDKTLLRNSLAFEISESLGFEYTPSWVMVDVVLDGFYYGNFMASDHIKINEQRINIDEMLPIHTAEPFITGGYHLEIDAYAHLEPHFFRTPRGVPFTIKSPDESESIEIQKAWIADHVSNIEQRLFLNAEEALDDYIDIESAVKYYLHAELTGNCDAYWCIPCYKKRGDDKLYFGPVWDFDQAFLTNERVPLLTETLSTQHGVAQSWFRQIMKTERAQTLLRKLWQDEKNKGLRDRLHAFLDKYTHELHQSQALNYERWNSLNRKVWFEHALFDSYQEYIDFVKQFIDDRFAWFDEHVLERKPLLPASTPDNPAQLWRYTINTPSSGWHTESFDDSQWNVGLAPFGTQANLQNTRWTTHQIFIRKEFFVRAEDIANLVKASFKVFYDEDCKIYLNGQLALERKGYLTDYRYFDFDQSLLKEGMNTLAVSCIQTVGGQLIDVGVYVSPMDVINGDDSARSVDWYVQDGTLYLEQLSVGDFVSVYTVDGKLVNQLKVNQSQITINLPAKGLYIIRINDQTLKVIY